MKTKKLHETRTLRDLMNVGKVVEQDLHRLGITTVEQLAQTTPDQLYTRIERLDGGHENTCVWDVFAAIIYEAQTGQATPWWHWTPIRHKRQRTTPLCVHDKNTTPSQAPMGKLKKRKKQP